MSSCCQHPRYLFNHFSHSRLSFASKIVFRGKTLSMPLDSRISLRSPFFESADDIHDICSNSYIIDPLFGRLSLYILAPCNHCPYCLEAYRSEISARAALEASVSDAVLFYTLTYDNKSLPLDGLHKEHVSSALVNLRNHIRRYIDSSITSVNVYVGEYGSVHGRPHYHGILFLSSPNGIDSSTLSAIMDLFAPVEPVSSRRPQFSKFYRSHGELNHFWPYGSVFDCQSSRNMIALSRYVTKYISKNYGFESSTFSSPCFIQLPKRRGLGFSALENHKSYILSACPSTLTVTCKDGSSCKVPLPRYYVRKLFPSLSDYCTNALEYHIRLKSLLSVYSSLYIKNSIYRNENHYSKENSEIPLFSFPDFRFSPDVSVADCRQLLSATNYLLSSVYFTRRLSRRTESFDTFISNLGLSFGELDVLIDEAYTNLLNCPCYEFFVNLLHSKSSWYDSCRNRPDIPLSQKLKTSRLMSNRNFLSCQLLNYSIYESTH